MILYPIKTIRLSNNTAEQELTALWRSLNLPDNQVIYAVYNNYESDYTGKYDFSVALEQENKQVDPIEINQDIHWFEIFKTKKELVAETWKTIWTKSQQGLLKRTYSIDFEKYYPDGTVEIYISIIPHC